MKRLICIGSLLCVAALGASITDETSAEYERTSKDKDFRLPKDVQTCYQDDPNLNQCVKEAIMSMLPRTNNGIKSLGISAIDPFLVERIQLEYANSLMQGTVKMKNLKTFGMSQANIKDVRMNIDGPIVKTELDVNFPRIFMEGFYKANIQFNELKLQPKGHFNATLLDIDATHKWAGNIVVKEDGHEYLVIDEFDMVPEVGDMKFNIEGIFPDSQLNILANNFLNRYWNSIYQMLLPETRSYWQPVMIDAINRFLETVPFDLIIKKGSQRE